MKFLASAIATAALILSGLVAAPTASAAPSAYPGSIRTICSIAVPNVRAGRRVAATVSVRTAGNGRPRGLIRVFVFNRNGKAIRVRERRYTGPRDRKVRLGKFRKGRYTARMRFFPDRNSVYRSCSDSDAFRVKRRR